MSDTPATIEDLKPDPKNPRTLSQHDGQALSNSLTKFGDLSCIVFNQRTQQLVGGHQRLNIMKQLQGEKRIEITKTFETPDEVGTVAIGYIFIGTKQFAYRVVDWDQGTQRAANIAANRIQGEFDKELLAEVTYELSQLENSAELLAATGMAEKELSALLDMSRANGEVEEDDAPDLDVVNPPVSKPGEIYQLGPHRLMCGDATDFGALSDLMNGELADMIFTDPLYNVAYEGKTADALTIQNDSMGDAEFYAFLLSVHQNMAEVTKAGGAIYVCHADSEGLNFRKSFMEAGFLLKECLIWVKQSMVLGRQDYQWQHEPILYGWKDGAPHYFVDDRTQTTVWNIDRPSRNAEHPTMKPIALCAKAIKNSSLRGQKVLDVFGGSGSTLMASEETGRVCYTMELDPRYVDVIRKRYAKHVGQEDWQAATPIVQAAEPTPAVINLGEGEPIPQP